MSGISQARQAAIIRPFNGILHTSQSDIIRLGPRIGAGAEGVVYEVLDRSDLVAKIYHIPPPPEKAEKIIALSRLGNERLFNLSAWPVDALRDAPNGTVVGFVMKKICGAEEVHTLHSPKSRLQKFPEASWSFLIYVAANVARAVAAIHEHGLVIGDLNPKNILVTRKATVSLLDVDSFQISVDGKTYRCDGGFPEYTPPELQGVAFREVDRKQEHDCFGLAVVIFQLLFMGRHPFSGNFLGSGEMSLERAIRESRFAYGADSVMRKMRQPPGALALESIPSILDDLFRRAFLTTDRPLSREWVEPLDALVKSLRRCSRHSGHYYYKRVSDCPWCAIENHARVRLFNSMLSGADSRRGHFRLDEIWKGIEEAEPPDSPMIRPEEQLSVSRLSEDVAESVRSRITALIGAITLSAVPSFLIGLEADSAAPLILFLLLAFVSRNVFKADPISLDNLLTIFQNRQSIPDDPLVRKVRNRHLKAEALARSLQERYGQEAGNARWGARREELENQKEAYENLEQIRMSRLLALETEAKKNQLDAFLKQFEIDDAEIKGVILTPIKKTLLSHGVETAADVVEGLKRIPSVGGYHAEKLLGWRRDLERRFIFDSAKSVSSEARIKVEHEVDQLRARLEHEISDGANDLSRVRYEIETAREKLKPQLLKALREASQAERDWKFAIKRNSFKPILLAIVTAFLVGMFTRTNDPLPGTGTLPYKNDSTSSGQAPPLSADSSRRADPSRLSADEYAVNLYNQGVKLSEGGNLEFAATFFQKAIERDKYFERAHFALGVALYRLGRNDEAVEKFKTVVKLRNDFEPNYYMGLIYITQERWDEAKSAFNGAIANRTKGAWNELHTQAYYLLGWMKTRVGESSRAIADLEARLKNDPELTTERLELGSLYLWVGKHKAAKAQYTKLKNSYPELAEELMGLINMHAARDQVPIKMRLRF